MVSSQLHIEFGPDTQKSREQRKYLKTDYHFRLIYIFNMVFQSRTQLFNRDTKAAKLSVLNLTLSYC